MANIVTFKAGDILIGQGDEETVAYVIQSGWLQVSRKNRNGVIHVFTLQAGEVVGELGLAGGVIQRTATVTALTDGEAEVIDRGALIRLVNGPASRLTPLLGALFARLKSSLAEDDFESVGRESKTYATLEGLNTRAKQALCNQVQEVTHLPWVFGSFRPPQSVTDLFSGAQEADVKLACCSHFIREKHIMIEAGNEHGLQLHLLQHGDYCTLDGERIAYGKNDMVVPLLQGSHELSFGDQVDLFEFKVEVL